MKQTTILREVSFSGFGLHTGHKARVFLKPALADRGYVFKRVDLPGEPSVAANWQNVVCTENRTVLAEGAAIINTVEHLISALVGSGIDNCLLEINGDEVPDLDGASRSFCNLIREAGIASLNKDILVTEVKAPLMVEKDNSFVACLPGEGYSVSTFVNFGVPEIFSADICEKTYLSLVSSAKTIGSWDAVLSLWKKGLAWGGSFCKVNFVSDEFKSFNKGGLSNEAARHKVLDFMGDAALLGTRLKGNFFCYKAGHGLHLDFMKQLSDFNCNFESHDLVYNDFILKKLRRIWG